MGILPQNAGPSQSVLGTRWTRYHENLVESPTAFLERQWGRFGRKTRWQRPPGEARLALRFWLSERQTLPESRESFGPINHLPSLCLLPTHLDPAPPIFEGRLVLSRHDLVPAPSAVLSQLLDVVAFHLSGNLAPAWPGREPGAGPLP